MDNMSKALIMAGGVLLALLIIGALLLMADQLSAYQRSDIISQKSSQVALFNQQFTNFFDEKQLKGTDIISLTNKVIDYNLKDEKSNYVDYEKKITLKIDLTGFAQDYGVRNVSKLFGTTTSYNIKYAGNAFVDAITKFSNLEKKYTLASMGKLKSNYTNLSAGRKTIIEVTGKEMPDITIDDIAKYIEYTELKSSTFQPVGKVIYDEGQVVQLEFKYIR